jgi:hypothetical protein
VSRSALTAGLRGEDKAVKLATHTQHRHIPSPISPHFVAPVPTQNLRFGPLALAAAVARTATTRHARPQLLAALQRSALPELECLISDGPLFGLSPDFEDLADSERTSFAARVGAGITDLYMNSLGYVWRDNAVCLSNALDPHADFVYGGGNADVDGVVLAEAHGSFAAAATSKSVASQAKRKYARQVKPYLGALSPHGQVLHGYSIAFGSRPRTSGAFLSLAETKVSKLRKKLPGPVAPHARSGGGAALTSIVLATHRSNFHLMGANSVVDWIDWARDPTKEPADVAPVAFFRLSYDGRKYLGSAFATWPAMPSRWLPFERWDYTTWFMLMEEQFISKGSGDTQIVWFVMEEAACTTFLDALSGIIRVGSEGPPELLELPTFDAVGFGVDGDDLFRRGGRPEYNYALFRDGLALISGPFRGRHPEIRWWSPQEGFEKYSHN